MQQCVKPVAIAYRRVSTKRQGQSGLGLDDQDARIREFCEMRHLQLDSAFTEVESGKRDDRPELEKALARVKRVRGILVVATLSRLSRRLSFVASLMDQSIPFACADAPDDEPFIVHVKASFDEEERRKISERTKRTLAVVKARGTKLGNPQNFHDEDRRKGAQVIRQRAAQANAALLPTIFALRAKGHSFRAIADVVHVAPMTVRNILLRAATEQYSASSISQLVD